jgi:16S rRNA (guanine966-N2)-methyltransferase
MTRIIAGLVGGRRIAVPRGGATRPTTDRVREALFSRLEAMGALDGARVLDLYAGSGALGLEAVSRGADAAVLVEADGRTAAVARRNIRDLDLPGIQVVAERAERFLAVLLGTVERFDLVLADPPYAVGEEALAAALRGIAGVLAPEGVVVVERSARAPEPGWPPDLAREARRTLGETTLWFAVGPSRAQ